MNVTGKSVLNREQFEIELLHQDQLINFKAVSKYFASRIMNNLMNNIHTEALQANNHLEKLFEFGNVYATEIINYSSEAMDVALMEFYKCKGVR